MPREADALTDPRTTLATARDLLTAGDHQGAFRILCDAIAPDTDFLDQTRAARLFARLDHTQLGLRRLRLALLAGSTLEHLTPILAVWLARAGFAADIFLAPFGTEASSVLDPASPLYAFRPDLVWLFTTHRDVALDTPSGSTDAAVQARIDQAIETRRQLWHVLRERGITRILQNNADLPAHDPFGNLSGAVAWGPRTALRRYNADLAAAAGPGVTVFDLDHIAGLFGRQRWTDPRYWFHSRHAFAPDATGLVAQAAVQLIAAMAGRARKCLVLDLDNTLWGGVIGDDGLAGIALGGSGPGEAFVAFQHYVRALKDRGIILAVCSKNDPETAALPFRDHPDCVLRLDDFAAFRANWDNKADNLRAIAATLDIGLDALVFADDNPAERDIVRRHLPEIAVVDLPDDPALFIAALAAGRWFESAGLSAEDAARGRYYRENAQRAALRDSVVDMDAYLAGLAMVASPGGADPLHLPRIAQLINKSNQFHLTGTRYAEADIAARAQHPDWHVRHLRLRDRFGDNGLISCVLLHRQNDVLHIDTWVMSCRVLGRTVEQFVSNEIAAIARAAGCRALQGRHVRTGRNDLVAGLYASLGFTCVADDGAVTTWHLSLAGHTAPWPTAIASQPPAQEAAA